MTEINSLWDLNPAALQRPEPQPEVTVNSWREMVERYDEKVASEIRRAGGLQRADGYTDEQVSTICSCCVSDGHPDEFCLLHGRTRYDGQWLGAKMVVINDWLPAGVIMATEQEVICSTETWEGIYQALERRNWCQANLHRILHREMGDVLSWLRRAGHEV